MIANLRLLLCSVLLCSAACAQTTTMKADELSRRSDVVVVGKVHRVAAEWDASHARIFTRVTVAVDQTVKGSPGGTVTLVIPGGEVGSVGEWYSHSPQFKENEDVLVFAQKDAHGALRVTDGTNGKLSLRRDEHTGLRMLPNGMPLDALMHQLTTGGAGN
jgi:hypothetical protein